MGNATISEKIKTMPVNETVIDGNEAYIMI